MARRNCGVPEGIENRPVAAVGWRKGGNRAGQAVGAVMGALVLGLLGGAPALAVEKEPSALFWATQEKAEWGDADAEFALGMMYLEGQDVTADPAQAARWLKKAYDQGHAQAAYQLGALYQQGKGVPRDEKLATEYFKRAGERGGAGVSEEQRDAALQLRLRLQEMEFEKEQQLSRQQHELKMLEKEQRHQEKLQNERNRRYYRGTTRSRGSSRYRY